MAFKESDKLELKKSTSELKEAIISVSSILNKHKKGEYNPLDFIKGEERSILRNPLIAHTLYLSKEIERWGSGIRRMYEECKNRMLR